MKQFVSITLLIQSQEETLYARQLESENLHKHFSEKESLEIEIDHIEIEELALENHNNDCRLRQQKDLESQKSIYRVEKQGLLDRKAGLEKALRMQDDNFEEVKRYVGNPDINLNEELEAFLQHQSQRNRDQEVAISRLTKLHQVCLDVMRNDTAKAIQEIADKACERACEKLTESRIADEILNRKLKQRLLLMQKYEKNLASSVSELECKGNALLHRSISQLVLDIESVSM